MSRELRTGKKKVVAQKVDEESEQEKRVMTSAKGSKEQKARAYSKEGYTRIMEEEE